MFKGIDLGDSFVLSWKREGANTLSFNLVLSIWPESEYYETPKENEYTCYRNGTLTITKIDHLSGLKEMRDVLCSTDVDGTVDYGNIDHFEKVETGFEIDGDFGSVIVVGGNVNLRVNET